MHRGRLVYIALGILTICGLTTGRLAAGISSTSGAVVVASPPSDISSGNWGSNTQIRAFAELQALTLGQDVNLDITQPGTSPSAIDSNLSPGVIHSGTTVNSYLIHFDIVGSLSVANAKEAAGAVTFSSDVIGLIALSASLNATNSIFGLPGITYASGADHGLELNPAGGGTSDIVTLSADRRTVSVDLRDGPFSDDLRVITAVPEPASAMILTGLAIVSGLSRRWLHLRRDSCR